MVIFRGFLDVYQRVVFCCSNPNNIGFIPINRSSPSHPQMLVNPISHWCMLYSQYPKYILYPFKLHISKYMFTIVFFHGIQISVVLSCVIYTTYVYISKYIYIYILLYTTDNAYFQKYLSMRRYIFLWYMWSV